MRGVPSLERIGVRAAKERRPYSVAAPVPSGRATAMLRGAALACCGVLLLQGPTVGAEAEPSAGRPERGADTEEMAWLDDTEWPWNEWSNVQLEKGGAFVSSNCEEAEQCRWWTSGRTLKIRWADAGIHTMMPSAFAANASTTLRGVRDIDGDKCSA